MRLGTLVLPVDERHPQPGTAVLSVSERRGIVPQADLFRRRLALADISRYRRVEAGDIVFNPFLLWNGAVGACYVEGGGCVSPAYTVLRPLQAGTSRFLHYLLRSESFKTTINAMASGTVTRRRTVPLQDILDVDVDVPNLDQQQAVDRLLGQLDSKIESNLRVARCAEALTLSIVKAREQTSWQREPVSNLARFVNGGAYTNGATGAGRMVIRIAELTGGPGPTTVYTDLQVPEENVARFGDVLMSWSGSLSVFRWVRGEAIINQHIFKVVSTTYPRWFVFAKLVEVLPGFRQIAFDKATTMGHIKRHHLDDARVAIPPADELRELDTALAPTWDRILLAERESLTLASLRDALLPELLSGRLGGSLLTQSSEAIP